MRRLRDVSTSAELVDILLIGVLGEVAVHDGYEKCDCENCAEGWKEVVDDGLTDICHDAELVGKGVGVTDEMPTGVGHRAIHHAPHRHTAAYGGKEPENSDGLVKRLQLHWIILRRWRVALLDCAVVCVVRYYITYYSKSVMICQYLSSVNTCKEQG
jgi:hypothetical protein